MTPLDALLGLAVGSASATLHLGLLWLRTRRGLRKPSFLTLTGPLAAAAVASPLAACALRSGDTLLSALLSYFVAQRLLLHRVRRGM